MGEANRRKKADAAREAAGLPTVKAIPASQLVSPAHSMPKPEYEKWGKPQEPWYPGKKDHILTPLFEDGVFEADKLPYDPAEAGKPYQGKRAYGRKNVYVCDSGHETVTVDTDNGVTPFMIVCPECQEYARSKMYRVDQTLEASHEWYRPDTLDGISPHNHDHVKRGGLIMRKIGYNENAKLDSI